MWWTVPSESAKELMPGASLRYSAGVVPLLAAFSATGPAVYATCGWADADADGAVRAGTATRSPRARGRLTRTYWAA